MLSRTVLPPKSTLVTKWVASTQKLNGHAYFATKTPLTAYSNNTGFNLRERANSPGPGGFSNKDIGIFLGSIIGFIALVLLLFCCFRPTRRIYAGFSSDEESSDDSALSKSAVPLRPARQDLLSSLEGHGAPQTSQDDDPIVEIVDEGRPTFAPKYKRRVPRGTKGTTRKASIMEETRSRRVPTTDAYSAATQSRREMRIPSQQQERYAAGKSVPAMISGKPVTAKRRRKVRAPKGEGNIVSPPITEAGDPPPPPPPPPPAPDAA